MIDWWDDEGHPRLEKQLNGFWWMDKLVSSGFQCNILNVLNPIFSFT